MSRAAPPHGTPAREGHDACRVRVEIWSHADLLRQLPAQNGSLLREGPRSISSDPRWLLALAEGLRQEPYYLQAWQEGGIVGALPLMLVRGPLFGRFLVSLPYLNSAGVQAVSAEAATRLIDAAVELADRHGVRYLELRHETPSTHPRLGEALTSKVHMRLALPTATEQLWRRLQPKVRNQIRKGQKFELSITWGRHELLDAFYDIFSRNMRDLGTPVFGKRLFSAILNCFPDEAELCVVRRQQTPLAVALLTHGAGVTDVQNASSLRRHNHTNANMLMYWHLLERAIERGQSVFDFGRSTRDSNTYRFKKQWGAEPVPAVWQYYVRQGSAEAMRRDNGRYDTLIRWWSRLPLSVTRIAGPWIVRGIP